MTLGNIYAVDQEVCSLDETDKQTDLLIAAFKSILQGR